MSDQRTQDYRLALINARVALQQKNSREARHWALAAAKISPNSEEPWLILAAISNPSASVAYLQRALMINPMSERATKGMQWALQRLSQVPIEEPEVTLPQETLPTPPVVEEAPVIPAPVISPFFTAEPSIEEPEEPEKPEITEDKSWPLEKIEEKPTSEPGTEIREVLKLEKGQQKLRKKKLGCFAPVMIAVLVLATALALWAALPDWIALARSSAAPIPANMLEKPSLTPTFTATATATSTFTPTATATATKKPTRTPTKTPKPTKTPQPQPTAAPVEYEPQGDTSGRWIDINLSEQMLYAYDGNSLEGSFPVSTGTYLHPTVTGQYYIYVKYLYTDMSGPGYYLPDVPYTMYFYSGYGIHGTYWHDNFGTPMSHGCVNMRTSDAGWLFDWASVGTLVNIHN